MNIAFLAIVCVAIVVIVVVNQRGETISREYLARTTTLVKETANLTATVQAARLFVEALRPQTLPLKLVEGGHLPERKTAGAAGLDCYVRGDHILPPYSVVRIPLGFACELPAGHVGLVVLRSSTAFAGRLDMPGGVGVVDEDFRGEVQCVVRTGETEQRIGNGERIAQLLVIPIAVLTPVEVEELSETERGAGGFGSTS